MSYNELVHKMKTADVWVMPADAGGPMTFSELEGGLLSSGDVQRFTAYWIGYAMALHDLDLTSLKDRNEFMINMALIACGEKPEW